MSDDSNAPVSVTSIFGAMTQRGLVELIVGQQQVTIPPAKAREIAGLLLECAASAEGDEALMRVVNGGSGLSAQRGLQLLRAMRTERNLIFQKARREAREAIAYDQHVAEDEEG